MLLAAIALLTLTATATLWMGARTAISRLQSGKQESKR